MARQHRSSSSIGNISVIAIALGLALPGIAGAQTIPDAGTERPATGPMPRSGRRACRRTACPIPAISTTPSSMAAERRPLDTNIVIQQLTFQNGTITGSNSLTMNALMTWSGGTFAGTSSILQRRGVDYRSDVNADSQRRLADSRRDIERLVGWQHFHRQRFHSDQFRDFGVHS